MNFRNDSISSVEPTDLSLRNKQLGRDSGGTDKTKVAPLTPGEYPHQPNPQILNIMDEYQFTGSQRSRTISFANQSILTEGIDQKNVYQMDMQSVNPFMAESNLKAAEFEIAQRQFLLQLTGSGQKHKLNQFAKVGSENSLGSGIYSSSTGLHALKE